MIGKNVSVTFNDFYFKAENILIRYNLIKNELSLCMILTYVLDLAAGF
jgi:hypothetical protein